MNECRTIPGICGNGGRCLNTNGSYSCFCKSGFYGKNCETFDPCRSMPCINDGTCMTNQTFPYWQCACPRSYTGKVSTSAPFFYFYLTGPHCEISVLSCASNPCRIGTCENLDDGNYRCVCPPSITGPSCNIPLLPCDSNPCLNNSTCLTLSMTNYTCVCLPSFAGPKCAEQRKTCSKNSCLGNGTCTIDHNTGEEVCQCPSGRYGIQ